VRMQTPQLTSARACVRTQAPTRTQARICTDAHARTHAGAHTGRGHARTRTRTQAVFYPNPTKLTFSVCLPECPTNFTTVNLNSLKRRAYL
jgi:hypothetical protein